MNDRLQLLHSLIALDSRFPESLKKLKEFPWESPEVVLLTLGHIASVLARYLSGEVTPEAVEEWADALECREDIGFPEGRHDSARQVIFELANPLLTQALSPDRAKELLVEIDSEP